MTIQGKPCIVVSTKNRVTITLRTGNRQSFAGKTAPEAELQLWNYLHRKPKRRGDAGITEADIMSILGSLDMPKQHIRISAGHIHQHPVYSTSWTVRRSIGEEGKIYFGTYRNEHAAKAASIRLCELINQEIDRRHFVRKCLGFEDVVLFDQLFPAQNER